MPREAIKGVRKQSKGSASLKAILAHQRGLTPLVFLARNPKTDFFKRSNGIEVVDACEFRHATPQLQAASYRQTGQVLRQRQSTSE